MKSSLIDDIHAPSYEKLYHFSFIYSRLIFKALTYSYLNLKVEDELLKKVKCFNNVNYLSIIAIFVIIMITFKSISLLIILVSVIGFAIFINMFVLYYSDTSLVFVPRIVIGSIQLGATVGYVILMKSHYHKERLKGAGKSEAVSIAYNAILYKQPVHLNE